MIKRTKKLKTDDRPEAILLTAHNGEAVIHCPLCQHQHRHFNVEPGSTEFRAAGCDLYVHGVTPEARAIGYWFRSPEKSKR